MPPGAVLPEFAMSTPLPDARILSDGDPSCVNSVWAMLQTPPFVGLIIIDPLPSRRRTVPLTVADDVEPASVTVPYAGFVVTS